MMVKHMFQTMMMGLIVSSLLISTASAQIKPAKRILTMGKVTSKVVRGQKRIEPIITYIASKLQDMGIEKGETIFADNNDTMIKYLKEGKLDLVVETIVSAAFYQAEASARPILLAWKGGLKEYNSIIFVRNDSGINRLEDLNKKIIAFEDPGSTSGYFLPKFFMKAKGLDLVEMAEKNSPVPQGKVGYIFADQEINVSSWVFFKKVAAGALSNHSWSTSKDNPAAYREKFKIIFETPKVPRALVLIREGLEQKLAARIKEELLRMDQSEEGRKALQPWAITKFSESPVNLKQLMKEMRIVLAEEL